MQLPWFAQTAGRIASTGEWSGLTLSNGNVLEGRISGLDDAIMYDSSRCAVNQCMPSLSHSLWILLLHDEHKMTVFFSVSVISSTLSHPLARHTASSLFRFRDIFSKPLNCVFTSGTTEDNPQGSQTLLLSTDTRGQIRRIRRGELKKR